MKGSELPGIVHVVVEPISAPVSAGQTRACRAPGNRENADRATAIENNRRAWQQRRLINIDVPCFTRIVASLPNLRVVAE